MSSRAKASSAVFSMSNATSLAFGSMTSAFAVVKLETAAPIDIDWPACRLRPLDGEADVTRGGKSVNRLGSGDFFGEIALVTHMPRTASVTAMDNVRVLVITERDFNSLLKRSPEISRGVAEALAERIAPDIPI